MRLYRPLAASISVFIKEFTKYKGIQLLCFLNKIGTNQKG